MAIECIRRVLRCVRKRTDSLTKNRPSGVVLNFMLAFKRLSRFLTRHLNETAGEERNRQNDKMNRHSRGERDEQAMMCSAKSIMIIAGHHRRMFCLFRAIASFTISIRFPYSRAMGTAQPFKLVLSPSRSLISNSLKPRHRKCSK